MKKLTPFIFLLILSFSGIAQRRNLLEDINPDNGFTEKGLRREIFREDDQKPSDSVSRKGVKSIRVEIKSDADRGDKAMRSEFAFESETNPERWYGLSIYAPSNYLPDAEPEIVTQWHNIPDFKLNETWTTPSLSLRVEDGHWKLHTLWDTARVTKQGHWMGELISDFGPVKNNVWTDWVFHIKFSYKADGLVEVYKNGVRIYSKNGPNDFNDVKLPYWKVGIYRWYFKDHDKAHHKYNQRVLFYSNIRKGSEKATYSDVAP